MSAQVYIIGLGANLGEPRETLARAVVALAELGRVLAVSSLYQTRPIGGPPQPDFSNAALQLAAALPAAELLSCLLAIERRFGRERLERFGPRTLDLDILWAGPSVRIATPRLTVPHPRLRGRLFALRPLLDLAPDAHATDEPSSYAEAAQALGDQGVTRVCGPEWALRMAHGGTVLHGN